MTAATPSAVGDDGGPLGVVVRSAGRDDAASIASLIARSKAHAMPWLPLVHTSAEDLAWVGDVLLATHDVRVAVPADAPGEALGVIALAPGWIAQLYIAPEAQGRGLGSQLLQIARDGASGPLRVWTFQRNSRARGFYERHGFEEVDRTDGDNEEGEPDVLYRWTPADPEGDSGG